MVREKSREFAGTLREWIRVERPVNVRDGSGSASGEFELIGEYHASATPAGTGAESIAESRSALLVWQFRMRQSDAILPGDRIIWNDRILTVRNVIAELRPTPRTRILAEENR
ncbi:Phage head-tail joining protein [Parasphingorhabdus marina DSM 22363]|uniref:Phage head-tail joining protein n=1 Tax=Parasphingorhabdus marina DSM 22363 TaxID=1123272 RepID=A0A1N6CMF3_9SPHN|nr:head-tail adaptor protein [Parasphingorhabdus marina]SIN59629.1 Phage head-tail joining protein [Parasphingorhabdus marina DSM 22363]